MKTSIIVPVYNEGQRAIETIKKILKSTKQGVIVVDDGSSDNSWSLLSKNYFKNERITMLRHVINLGKGAAMKTGAEKAWELGSEAIIYIDADGQHNPRHLGEFEKLLKSNSLVFGYRLLGKNAPFVRRLGNVIVKKLVELLFHIRRKDILCGFIGLQKIAYYQVLWESNRYGVETEMATIVGKKKLSFVEVKVDTIYIDKYKGVTISDALKILTNVPSWYFKK